jgi:hypothetical protein
MGVRMERSVLGDGCLVNIRDSTSEIGHAVCAGPDRKH